MGHRQSKFFSWKPHIHSAHGRRKAQQSWPCCARGRTRQGPSAIPLEFSTTSSRAKAPHEGLRPHRASRQVLRAPAVQAPPHPPGARRPAGTRDAIFASQRIRRQSHPARERPGGQSRPPPVAGQRRKPQALHAPVGWLGTPSEAPGGRRALRLGGNLDLLEAGSSRLLSCE